MRIPLIGGAYATRSPIGSSTRAINLYPEKNSPVNARIPMTHYQRPGLTPMTVPQGGAVRGLYSPSTNVGGYAVIGKGVYYISPSWSLTQLGILNVQRPNNCIFSDNGQVIFLVDGSSYGYQIGLGNNSFSVVSDPTNTFSGSLGVDYIDTYFLWSFLNSQLFGSSLSNELQFNNTYFAAKTSYPDLLQRVIVNKHNILLIGTKKSEIWYDAGNALFPFAQLPGTYIEHGTCAPYSCASEDNNVYWLSQNLQGKGMVLRQRGYETKRVSNHAIEFSIRKMYENGIDISDAIGFTFQLDGHVFYMLIFPSGNQTWVYDSSIDDPLLAWHQECWTDQAGNLNRHRANCCACINGIPVVGDWQNGTIYKLDLDAYKDVVPTQPAVATTYIRTFPHLEEMTGMRGRAPIDQKLVKFTAFYADIESGSVSNETDPQVGLRFSNDRGRTWGSAQLRPLGPLGHYATQPIWRTIGLAREMIFELSYSVDGPAALNGAWVDAEILNN